MFEALLETAKKGEPFTPEQMAEIKTLKANQISELGKARQAGEAERFDKLIVSEMRRVYNALKGKNEKVDSVLADVNKMSDEKLAESYHSDKSQLLNEVLMAVYNDENTSGKLKEEVRNRLFEKNKGLVFYVVKKFSAKDDGKTSNDDLAQECVLAFYSKAIPTYDITKGFKFSTYTTQVIYNLMSTQHKSKYNKARTQEISMETPIADDGGSIKTLLDYQADPHLTPEEEFRLNQDKEILYDALNDLTLEQKFIAYCRYGLGDVPIKTQAEIADYMHMSQANVSKIEGIMKTKLMQALRARDY